MFITFIVFFSIHFLGRFQLLRKLGKEQVIQTKCRQREYILLRLNKIINCEYGKFRFGCLIPWSRPGICGKYFFSFPQKKLWPEKTEIAKCLLFNFWVIKLTKISILPNCLEPNYFLGYNCNLSFKNWSLGKKTLL